MKRIFYIVILLALSPTLVNAFGLGNLDLNSALNEPFDARIQLLSPTADELDSLKIALADSEAFARAKVDRPFILSKLKFALRRSVDDGPDYIRVFSHDPIREPFLNFLVEVSWSNGRLFREYTVLLDPPLYDPNSRASEFAQVAESSTSMEAVTIDDPDHQVTYGDAYEKFAKSSPSPSLGSTPSSTYTPNVNYTGGDFGPTTGSDTLWSIASKMRPDTSTSVNQMMLALLKANPDAFINQNINNLKRGQILRMPNESEMNALSNAEALSEAQSQHSSWGDTSVVSERPEVSSVSETSSSASDDEMMSEEVVDTDPELKLVAADDAGEATEQVSSVDSGSGEELVLAQETIQVLTQENIELKDRVQESEALLDDLKRLLSLKDDELAALQEQMAAAAEAEQTAMEEAEEVAEAEEEMMEEVEEDVAEAEEEMMEEVEEDVAEAEEEMMEVVQVEPESGSTDIMGMVNQYIAKAKDILLGNPMIGMAVGGILLLLIIIVVLLKFRKGRAETVDIDAMTEEAFPDFDSGDLGDTGAEVSESEAVTVLPDSEAETAVAEESADVDVETEEVDEEKTQFMSVEETEEVAEEEPEEEEDPLQEVNTYLAFEQFDQAEEFVRNVINDNPDNPEFDTKLLEVFYTSGNKKKYEEAAQVLNDKVGGEGEHWNMAVAMWQEMSPNRALFEEGDDDDDSADTTGGGFVDVTADEETGDDSGGDLDFDIGGAEEETVAEAATDGAEEMLDITASDEGEELLDITASAEEEDLLDVTAAVGLGEEIDSESAAPATDDDILDISGTGGEDLLDLTANEESSDEDLLDVTAAANLDLDSEEDLLDVTAATSAGADSSDLLEVDIDGEKETEEGSDEIELDVPAADDGAVEFDLDIGEAETPAAESAEEDNALDFDMTSSEESNDIELEIGEPEANESDDAGLEMDLGISDEAESNDIELETGEPEANESDGAGLEIELDTTEDDEPIQLDVGDDEATSEGDDDLSLDLDMGDEGDIELDLSIEEDVVPEAEADSADDSPEIDFDFNLDDTSAESTEEASIDLDGTVELPKSALSDDDDDDDDDDDEHTVFVPRAAQPEEQSVEDEIATKLDLAKAYVELGDKDSAKAILDEVMAEGNDEQRQQAEDLLGQV